MAEHDSSDNRDKVTHRAKKSDKNWWRLLGNDPKLYDAWVKFCKEHNLPFNSK